MTSLVSANAASLTVTGPSGPGRIDVDAAPGWGRLPPRTAGALRAMNSRCAAIVACTLSGLACSQARSSSQMNTMYSAISPPSDRRGPARRRRCLRVDDLGHLDAHVVSQPRAARRELASRLEAVRADDDVPGQHPRARIAVLLAGQRPGRADPVTGVGDPGTEPREPGAPLLFFPSLRAAIGLAAERQDVLTHDHAPFRRTSRSPVVTSYVGRPLTRSTTARDSDPDGLHRTRRQDHLRSLGRMTRG